MKKRILSIFCIIMLLTALLLSTGCNQKDNADNEVYELRFAHFFPATHPAETVLVKEWSAAIEEATNNKVKVTSFPGQTLSKAATTYNDVVEGTTDIGMSCFSYSKGRFPVLEAFELPGTTYLNSKSASMTAWEGIKELNPKEVEDTHLLMVIATGPGDLFTKDPVEKIEDLKGMEIRATGLSAQTVESLGAVPVGMPQSDTYESLSKGIVKGNLSPIEVLKGWKHAEVTDYITKTPFLYNTLFFVTMNNDKWNALPKDIQTIITDTTESFMEETAIGLWDMQNESALTYALDEEGMQIIELPENEAQKFIDAVQGIQDEYQKKLDEEGIEDDVLAVVKKLSTKFNEQYK